MTKIVFFFNIELFVIHFNIRNAYALAGRVSIHTINPRRCPGLIACQDIHEVSPTNALLLRPAIDLYQKSLKSGIFLPFYSTKG